MASRLLAIAAELSAPPSSPLVFRDLTLFASVFRHYEVVATVQDASAIDSYNRWFKSRGLWDFVEDLIEGTQLDPSEVTVEIEGGADARLTAHNLADVLRLL